jgi:hypothetical protein
VILFFVYYNFNLYGDKWYKYINGCISLFLNLKIKKYNFLFYIFLFIYFLVFILFSLKFKGNIVIKIIKEIKFLTYIIQSGFVSHKLMTMDLETRVRGDNRILYCICLYEGHQSSSWYLFEYSN